MVKLSFQSFVLLLVQYFKYIRNLEENRLLKRKHLSLRELNVR